jgi:hypothetical protein
MSRADHEYSSPNHDRDMNLIDRIIRDVQSWIEHGSKQWSRHSRGAEPSHRPARTPNSAAYARHYYGDEAEPGEHAPHHGKGPRGYVRPDSRVYEDVCDRLTGHGQIDASALEVSVADGIVKLSGTVDSRADKRLAESLADSVSGVRDVDNSLTLRGASENIS